MHCSSCSTVITKNIEKLDGVNTVNVNYATEKAQIEFIDNEVSLDKINLELNKFGYTLNENIVDSKDNSVNIPQENINKENDLNNQRMKTHFVLPVSFLVFIIMMWEIGADTFISIPNLPLPMELLNILSMILATVVMFWIGQPYINGIFRFIKYRVANMDTLIGIGTMTAYLYSSLITLFPQIKTLMNLPEYTYFDVVIVVVGFITLGKYLEARSKQKTGEAIEKLLELQAKTALVIRDGKELEISINDVILGDIIIVKPGAKIPVDGKILEGNTSIDESMITGESIPIDKKIGDIVIGSTINKQGNIKIVATKIGSDTMLSQIIRMVEDAQGSKAPIQALVDKISGIFVPVVLIIAIITLALWLLVGIPILGQSVAISYGILSFVGILIIACPCALGLATPTAIIVGVGKGAQNGILIKDAESLELLNKVNTIVLDKTGTITKGKPEVTDIVIIDSSYSNLEILKLSGSLEKYSEHPLAESVANYAILNGAELVSINNFISLEGIGVKGEIENKNLFIRKPEITDKYANLRKLQTEGKTVVIFEINNKAVALIALSDTVKDNAVESIARLQKRGIEVIMLTGDNHLAAEYIAKQVNIKKVFAEVLPGQKVDKIKELQAQGLFVAMAGDGINDAPALTQANVGIAMATGSDIAIESAGIALLHGDIHKISQAIDLSKSTMKTIKQNLFWAFIYNVVGIPLAAGLFYPIWGITLNPVFAGLAMAFSSVSVVGNSLRLKSKKLK